MSDMDPVLKLAPVPVLFIDPGRTIIALNERGTALLGANPGDHLDSFVHADSLEQLQRVLELPHETFELQLQLDQGQKAVEAFGFPGDDDEHHVIFFLDISEKVALGRQLRSTRQPSRRLFNQLHAANTSVVGYAELISMMLDEEPIITGERLTVIRRYHKELQKALDSIDRLLKFERLGGRRPDPSAVPINRKHVLVVDDEPPISDYVAELMRGLQHKVSAFSDGSDALKFLKDNLDRIDLVIADHRMPGVTGAELADVLHQERSDVPVVLCSEEDISVLARDRQTYHCPKPIDITELTRMVGELI